ncbi:MAG: Omp28-related outer membrane protein [Bacteroidales bacterium]|jgi:hypothetical protein|nr:Omp28-related outer membrane protein [Bacteroidales bacterium]
MKKLSLFSMVLCLLLSAINAQTFVSTTPSNKNVILEEYTGVNCQYCPDGHRLANQLMATNPNRAWAINIHQGGYANTIPDYRTDFGDALANQTGLDGYPVGTINRHVFSGGKTALNRGDWASAAATILAQPSPVNIAAQSTLDFATRQLIVTVEVYYTGSSAVSSNFINVALLQNNILGPQVGSSYNPSQIINGQYSHQHMLRHLLTGQWGDEVTTTTSGTFVSRTYTYSIPAAIRNVPVELIDLDVIVFITEGHQEVITGAESSLSVLNGIPYFSSVSNIRAYDCDAHFAATLNNVGWTEPITSAGFEYVINGVSTPYQWTGNIAVNESADVEFPPVEVPLGVASSATINLLSVNGTATTEQNSTINKNVTLIRKYAATPPLTLKLVTDRYASETTYKVFNSEGTVIDSGGPWANLPNNGTTIHLIPLIIPEAGCFSVEIFDSYGDGINSGAGAGYVDILDSANRAIVHSNGKFGTGIVFYLECTRATPLSVETLLSDKFNLYPNPTTGLLRIESELPVQGVDVFNVQGQKVANFNNTNELDVTSLSAGIYVIKINSGTEVHTTKFVKQ